MTDLSTNLNNRIISIYAIYRLAFLKLIFYMGGIDTFGHPSRTILSKDLHTFRLYKYLLWTQLTNLKSSKSL